MGSRRTLRNWTAGWTTVKNVAQEGRKVKPIPPPTHSRITDRKINRTNLTGLKRAEDFPFLFPPFALNSFFLSVPLSFFYSLFLPSFPFLFPFSLLPFFFSLFFFSSPISLFPTDKTWSAEKTRVRPCYTHKCQLKTSEHRRLRRQHH